MPAVTPLALVETVGVLFGLLSVYYAAREDVLTWPAGLVNVVLFAILFWSNRLYLNVGLQGFYFLYSLYSWYMWLYGGEARSPLALSFTPGLAWPVLLLVAASGTLGMGWVFDVHTDNPQPYWDAATVALSVVAQFMLTRKWLENWAVWIVANLIYLGLGLWGANYQFAALQVVYIALSVMGYRRWSRSLASSRLVVAEDQGPGA
jgi:nicotinamide mononucleotide transporter